MRFLVVCLVSIDSSSRAHFETLRNSYDIGTFGGLKVARIWWGGVPHALVHIMLVLVFYRGLGGEINKMNT